MEEKTRVIFAIRTASPDAHRTDDASAQDRLRAAEPCWRFDRIAHAHANLVNIRRALARPDFQPR
jgi:hypothetical protein